MIIYTDVFQYKWYPNFKLIFACTITRNQYHALMPVSIGKFVVAAIRAALEDNDPKKLIL